MPAGAHRATGGFATRLRGLQAGAPMLPQARPRTGAGMFARGRRAITRTSLYLLWPALRQPALDTISAGRFGSGPWFSGGPVTAPAGVVAV